MKLLAEALADGEEEDSLEHCGAEKYSGDSNVFANIRYSMSLTRGSLENKNYLKIIFLLIMAYM